MAIRWPPRYRNIDILSVCPTGISARRFLKSRFEFVEQQAGCLLAAQVGTRTDSSLANWKPKFLT